MGRKASPVLIKPWFGFDRIAQALINHPAFAKVALSTPYFEHKLSSYVVKMHIKVFESLQQPLQFKASHENVNFASKHDLRIASERCQK